MVRAARPQLVIEHLQALIHHLHPGDRLPSETALGQELKVSRNTVRDALSQLERDGMIVRQHGLGTFVAQPRQLLHASLNRVLPIPEVIRESGYTPRVDDWSIQRATAGEQSGEALGLPPGTAVDLLDILYCADGRPAVQVTYALSPRVSASVPTWSDFEPEGGLIAFLNRHLPAPLSHTSTKIAAVSADERMSSRLKVSPGAPLLRFVSVGLNALGEALYHSVSYQAGDFLDVHIQRQVVAGPSQEHGPPGVG